MISLFGRIGEETPKFDLLKKAASGYEIRRYHRQLRASVTFNDSNDEGPITQGGFRELAGYIFGGNKTRSAASGTDNETIAMTAPVMTETTTLPTPAPAQKIAMTAPVMTATDATQKKTTMSFILPSKYASVSALPVPNDADVKLEEVEPYTVACLRFSGRWTSEVTEAQAESLVGLLKGDAEVEIEGGEGKGRVMVARYNPPWTLPFLRTNEIMIPVRFLGAEREV